VLLAGPLLPSVGMAALAALILANRLERREKKAGQEARPTYD
jgi:hypothetical protein